MQIVVALLLLLVGATAAQAAAIAHTCTTVTTAQTTTSSSMGDVSGASISNANLTAGDKYLLVVSAQMQNNSSNDKVAVQIVHGSTAFSESRLQLQEVGTPWFVYGWMTVWTAVSTEDVKMQFSVPDGNGTGSADQISMCAINLSHDVTENTDWFFNANTSSTTLTTSFQDFASITFTPGSAGQDWLVLAVGQYDSGFIATEVVSSLNRSGEASSANPQPNGITTGGGTLRTLHPLARAYNLGAATNTFKVQAKDAAAVANHNTHLASQIFAINLAKFKNHSVAYTDGTVSLSSSDFATNIQTLSITPTVTSDVWIGAGFNVINDGGDQWKFRMQLDSTDQPGTQTADAYGFDQSRFNTDADPGFISTIVSSVSTASHTLNADASVVTGSMSAQHRQAWAVTMELAAAGGGGGGASPAPATTRPFIGGKFF